MKKDTRTAAVRYVEMFAGLAALIATGRYLDVNPTAVALVFLITVLFVSAYWGLRHAVVLSVAATAAFNFFFLPPLHTFTIADPQNWIALVAFLVTALVAGNLSERARREAQDAKRRRHEVERLYALSQQLLTMEDLVSLLNKLPAIIADTFSTAGAALFVTDRTAAYRSGPEAVFDDNTLRAVAARGEPVLQDNGSSYVPLRVGVKTVGALAVAGGNLSRESLEAIGSLAGMSIERARAVDQVTLHRAAQESERLRSALLDSVTHEFRTPLTSIKASVSSLLTAAPLDADQQKELLTVIDEETDRLNRLVGEAAEMAQLDSGLVKLDLRSHDTGDVVDSALETTRHLLQKHTVEVSIAAGLPQLTMDAERIREVITHLLENAAKYSPAGTSIRLTAEREGRNVVVSVADHGPGIDSFEQPLIFEKFYRGKNQQYAAHGTGMGLAIAKTIVEAHGGNIGVVSQLGQGSVFWFKLPIRTALR
ncbi:MAG TPA: ATP-binding protein [Candidatus Eisenbacteria bacterium]|nr:ATP-binding protein [Candidatus Eisenbacteria bacterium]